MGACIVSGRAKLLLERQSLEGHSALHQAQQLDQWVVHFLVWLKPEGTFHALLQANQWSQLSDTNMVCQINCPVSILWNDFV